MGGSRLWSGPEISILFIPDPLCPPAAVTSTSAYDAAIRIYTFSRKEWGKKNFLSYETCARSCASCLVICLDAVLFRICYRTNQLPAVAHFAGPKCACLEMQQWHPRLPLSLCGGARPLTVCEPAALSRAMPSCAELHRAAQVCAEVRGLRCAALHNRPSMHQQPLYACTARRYCRWAAESLLPGLTHSC
ncbi:LAMI_0G10528g1_1 [Lachancea mirantina]|uniref:LAMI_0G10528g1_1 n=1 Tax=Lachancea mirantina TaxID=1230905 RepID=A0A1G4KAP1_9SACH|nr:LAMI_0G10528g1_1 [Lachancea mirantina]